MVLRKIATISDKIKTFIQSGNYESYILRLMMNLKAYFQGYMNNIKNNQKANVIFMTLILWKSMRRNYLSIKKKAS